jgi:hypothetical protein
MGGPKIQKSQDMSAQIAQQQADDAAKVAADTAAKQTEMDKQAAADVASATEQMRNRSTRGYGGVNLRAASLLRSAYSAPGSATTGGYA